MDKEKTRKVFDAENGKIGSGEALPERSDRERDVPVHGCGGEEPPQKQPVFFPRLNSNQRFFRNEKFSISPLDFFPSRCYNTPALG